MTTPCFKRFLNSINKKNKKNVIVYLNKVVWRLDKQDELFVHGKNINNYVNNESIEIIKELSNKNHKIHLISDSDNSTRNYDFIENTFNDIHITSKLVYPCIISHFTHFNRILKNYNDDFILFDSRNYILEKIKKLYPYSTIFWCPNQLTYHTFKNHELKRINFPQIKEE